MQLIQIKKINYKQTNIERTKGQSLLQGDLTDLML